MIAEPGSGMFPEAEDMIEALFPQMPEDLRPYDRTIRRGEVIEEADATLAAWIRSESGDVEPWFADDERPPCAAPGVRADFIPDYPDPEDRDEFPLGTNSLEYGRRQAIADISMARAKSVCFNDCPLRQECLVRSILSDDERLGRTELAKRDRETFDWYSVLGGWGPEARWSILARFRHDRAAYRKASHSHPLSDE